MSTGRRRFKTWRKPNAGRCRNCGTLYIPEPHKGGEYKEGEVEEVEYCDQCALRCPFCNEWLPGVEGQATGRYDYNLNMNEGTGKFELDEDERIENELLEVWCPRCMRKLDLGLFQS